ncbi:unnamed protein product [Ranitomeya imitator]|uniref:Uncharacterized protein n=1 Tax=Ranitomeya imitator TaxID=111125 RepID=A0ABN9LRG7_9NEOB|nr:unnamed protein product [Ranitomeya imitator]
MVKSTGLRVYGARNFFFAEDNPLASP